MSSESRTSSLNPTQPIRVAVLEDDEVFRAAFVAAVNAAPDAEICFAVALRSEALACLAQHPPADVFLVDIGLPDGSGIDVIRKTQEVWPGCSVVVTTAFADENHVLQCIEAGAMGYLLKDSSTQNIVQEIRNVHQGGSPISPLIARRILQRMRPAAPAAPHGASSRRPELSSRETEVLQLFSKGFSYSEIAQRLGVSRNTVLTFVRRIYAKLEVNSQMEAVHEARLAGLLH
ncbi:response regulator transcription factor [uncultured Rhodoferax sp.]|uniref:response regulator transcription factor n=1 Tax=uncultured Rhodoferax sp. TaxID=223188 RepID=UPI002600DF8E|nr:response regulator transcription factor [uncultured Rhodoferax sp.]